MEAKDYPYSDEERWQVKMKFSVSGIGLVQELNLHRVTYSWVKHWKYQFI